ncbi:hypothetical protein [Entomospira culicis]|uniref:hypothetical protein n=1 Tax=Entomospira culicis TaxID=2719989 RepID=UPI0023682056|nr:hypothetical protein [Entomospira culicis]WDI37734.1 hypothetical protein PVA46_02830 [Entomospira culicis]
MQTILNAFALSVLLSIAQRRLALWLEPQLPNATLWVTLGDLLSQLLILSILAMPMLVIAYLLIRILSFFHKIPATFTPYLSAVGLVGIALWLIYQSSFTGLYIYLTFGAIKSISEQFYFIAIGYLMLNLFLRSLKNQRE